MNPANLWFYLNIVSLVYYSIMLVNVAIYLWMTRGKTNPQMHVNNPLMVLGATASTSGGDGGGGGGT